MNYTEVFKSLSDSTRLEIVCMLSERGELCACRILERFDITQPTLSHHMKSLCNCGLVNTKKMGKWSYYSLNKGALKEIKVFFNKIDNSGKE